MIDVNFDGLGMWWDLQEDGELIELGFTYQVTANVFTLTDDDERKFKRTKNLTHVTKLLPASHHDECELKSAVKKYSKENDVNSELRRHADSDTYLLTIITAKNPIFYIVPNEDNILELDNISELNNDPSTKSNNSSSTKDTTSNKLDWKVPARAIGLEVHLNNPKYNLESIAKKTHNIMKSKHAAGEPGMINRSGKIPEPGTIKRHALNKIKT